jgi:hypothetical protein
VTPLEDAWEAYEAAQERAVFLRGEWERLGRPVLSEGSKGQLIVHPLLGAIAESEVIADRLRQRLVNKHPGPRPSAVLGLDAPGREPAEPKSIGPSPAAELRRRNGA